MGNSSGKETRSSGEGPRSPTSPSSASFPGQSDARGSRHDVSFFGIGHAGAFAPVGEVRKETRQEREARKLEKERVARVKERERSLRDESVDGGYLVTLGTYTGPEDFGKSIVRQLMIERRLAPFWRGLNDHSDSWTEHQLVAAAKGKPIPAPDEIPEQEEDQQSPTSSSHPPGALAVPASSQANSSFSLSASHPVSSSTNPLNQTPPVYHSTSSSPLFRGRAKTLASLASSSKNHSQTEITPQEMQSPRDPYINGMRIEACLYKDVLECPICFLYYPPYLNKTRCCDQPICSECFVQIKRPDPHPPEHLDPNTPVPEGPPRPEDSSQLVSEPATCPFCVQAEFGVSYSSPSFRRGLVYHNHAPSMARTSSAMSSSSDLSGVSTPVGSAPPTTGRRRTESLSANAPTVITTDKVRPDWAKKLSDARAHQARRSAAATALHTAAYLMGSNQPSSAANPFSRRRRAETAGSNGPTGQAGPDIEQLMAALDARRPGQHQRGGSADLYPARSSSQQATTAQDIEDIMLMEAIRLSIAAEEERKKKEEKESSKQAKKDEKQKAKDQKKAEKAAKKGGLYSSSANNSTILASYTSNTTLSSSAGPVSSTQAIGQLSSGDDVAPDGKGKARASSTLLPASTGTPIDIPESLKPLGEPTSTLNIETASAREDPQKHLEQSRANIATTSSPIPTPAVRGRARGDSAASHASSTSDVSFGESAPNSYNGAGSSFETSPRTSATRLAQGAEEGQTPPSGSAGLEPMFNFQSLAEMIGKQTEDGFGGSTEHVEHTQDQKHIDTEVGVVDKTISNSETH
ncbi:hypothetical protein FH972_022252 [Carpinus fangiana]|uniref:Protein SIP5 n=1 Tax=Carpinus fangiana TaxID=176857 RepID=A0A5N6KS94_9ROSI|nr:hypothetical protein FH972_022252 [Carpinus fangiana]